MSKQSRWPRWLAWPEDLMVAGVVGAGLALSLAALKLAAHVTHLSPLPAPLGVAFAKTVFPKGSLGPHGLVWAGLGLHVAYVGGATVAYVAVLRARIGAVTALGWAVGLWVFAGLVFAPLVGWGFFAAGLGAGAAVNLLAIHLLYGVFLWAGARVAFRGAPGPASAPRSATSAPRVVAAR